MTIFEELSAIQAKVSVLGTDSEESLCGAIGLDLVTFLADVCTSKGQFVEDALTLWEDVEAELNLLLRVHTADIKFLF